MPSKIDVKRKRPPKKTPPWDHLLLRACSLFHSLFPLSSAFPTAFLTCLPLNIDFVWEAKPACLMFSLGSVPCSSHRLPTALGGSSLGQHRRWSPSPSTSPRFDQREIHLQASAQAGPRVSSQNQLMSKYPGFPFGSVLKLARTRRAQKKKSFVTIYERFLFV